MTELNINAQFGSILVVVPHQDDEILMAAGILHAAAVAGVAAGVVMATNGDYECADFSKGRKRLSECLAGLRTLGLCDSQVTFLGYADTGMEEEVSFLHRLYAETDGDKIVSSSCSRETYGLPEKPEYHMEAYGKHAAYTRKSFRQDLKEVILKKRPDHIFTTSRYDLHGDHSALYLFVEDVLKELKGTGYEPQLYTGIVHSGAGDENWPLRAGKRFTCPKGFELQKEFKWEERICFPLPQDMLSGSDLKKQALEKHEEALEPNAVEYLMSFLKEEEIFFRVQV